MSKIEFNDYLLFTKEPREIFEKKLEKYLELKKNFSSFFLNNSAQICRFYNEVEEKMENERNWKRAFMFLEIAHIWFNFSQQKLTKENLLAIFFYCDKITNLSCYFTEEEEICKKMQCSLDKIKGNEMELWCLLCKQIPQTINIYSTFDFWSLQISKSFNNLFLENKEFRTIIKKTSKLILEFICQIFWILYETENKQFLQQFSQSAYLVKIIDQLKLCLITFFFKSSLENSFEEIFDLEFLQFLKTNPLLAEEWSWFFQKGFETCEILKQ